MNILKEISGSYYTVVLLLAALLVTFTMHLHAPLSQYKSIFPKPNRCVGHARRARFPWLEPTFAHQG